MLLRWRAQLAHAALLRAYSAADGGSGDRGFCGRSLGSCADDFALDGSIRRHQPS